MKGAKPGRCAVFDLDGTLIDSREDLANAVNLMRAEFGLEPLPLATVVSFVGDGMRKLVERALKGETVCVDGAIAAMKDAYRLNLVERTTLYPGVFDGVYALKDAGWTLAVISNKPTEFCRIILDRFRIEMAFSHVIGGGPEFPLKPDPSSLNFILESAKAQASASWMVGDNHTDLEAGARAGMKKCYAAYGFGDIQGKAYDLKAAKFSDFVDAVLKEG